MFASVLLVLALATPAFAQVIGAINTPAANGTVGQPFTISGWTLDSSSGSGTGVDAVDVWGCPVLNCSTPSYWGAATYGLSRPDVAAWLGNQFLYSGFSFVMSGLTPGAQYYAKVFARRASTQQWTEFTVQFTATATPILVVETPGNLAAVTQAFQWAGYAIDGSAPSGTGMSLIDLYTYPNPGSGTAAVYLGSGGYGVARSDVAAAYGSRFLNSGYTVWKNGLTPGEHQFITYAYSPTNGWVVNSRTTYVDIPTVTLTIDRNGTGTGGVTASGLSCAGGVSTQAVPCSQSYAHNTSVTLMAVPDSGSAFAGWSGGGCSGFSTCAITMSNAKFVSAMFTKNATSYVASYYHTDRIGSVRAMTDAAGNLVGPRHDYAPFGEDTQALAGNPMRFGGKELDAETALHYFEARYYGQTWGRFTQVDPLHVGAAMTDPQQWNRYAYARNNPLAYVDPTGLCVNMVFDGQSYCVSESVTVTDRYEIVLTDNGRCMRVGGGTCQFVDFDNFDWSIFGANSGGSSDDGGGGGGKGGGPGPNTGVGPSPSAQRTAAPAEDAGEPSDIVNAVIDAVTMLAAAVNPVAGVAAVGAKVGYNWGDWSYGTAFDGLAAVVPFGTLPSWVKNGNNLVSHAKNLQRAGSAATVSTEVADDIVLAARKWGVDVRLDPPHPGTPWEVPHLNVGRNGQAHVPVPAGYRLPK